MWLPHVIESPVPEPVTELNAGRCRTIHSEVRYNYFVDVLLAQPAVSNDSQRVNRWNVLALMYCPAPKGCGSSRVVFVGPAFSEM